MDIGISTACFYPMATEETISIIKNMGFHKIEVFMEAYSEYEEDFAYMLRNRIADYGLQVISAHSFCSTYEPFLFSEYDRRRQDSVKVLKKALNAAKILGAKYFTFHGNRKEATTGNFDFQKFGEQMTFIAELAREYNIMLAWENVCWCQSCSPDFIEKSLEYIRSDNLAFTLDIKQAYRAQIEPTRYIHVMKDRIANVHINDADSQHSCLLPGQGKVNLLEIIELLRTYGYDGELIIEIYSSNFENNDEIVQSKKYLEKLLDD